MEGVPDYQWTDRSGSRDSGCCWRASGGRIDPGLVTVAAAGELAKILLPPCPDKSGRIGTRAP